MKSKAKNPYDQQCKSYREHLTINSHKIQENLKKLAPSSNAHEEIKKHKFKYSFEDEIVV